MDSFVKTALWQQLGAAIDMLENALLACPATLWHEYLWSYYSDHALPPESASFWYLSYHTLFWLDLYFTGSFEGFAPPAPFTLAELDPAGVLPERPYSQEELHHYLRYVRQKCRATIEAMSDERAQQPIKFPWASERRVSFLEQLLYTMRHVQEHAAQLNMFLGQHAIEGASGWVGGAKADKE